MAIQAIWGRMLRAVRGEVSLFEEVEHDPGATAEAILVVAIGAISVGLGFGLSLSVFARPGNYLPALVGSVVSTLLAYAVFSGVVYLVGTRVFGGTASWEEVLRTLGYAYSPLAVGVVAIVPFLGWLIVAVAALWALYLAYVAMRAALDLDGGRTAATIVLAIIPAWIINSLIGAIVRL